MMKESSHRQEPGNKEHRSPGCIRDQDHRRFKRLPLGGVTFATKKLWLGWPVTTHTHSPGGGGIAKGP